MDTTKYHSVLLDNEANATGQCNARNQADPKVAMLPLVVLSTSRSPN
jgi:hypothetical protein